MVYFVGAGSGAVDLITVRGLRLLHEAELLIYAGSLVNEAFLEEITEECLVYNSATMTLEEILEVMEKNQKKKIVRLHTGDPSIFGAIREQMEGLKKRKIPFELCPGVSSMCGAAAALQVEYTVPNISQSVIITRVEGKTPVPEKEKLSLLAKHQSTMVIFLSTRLAKKVQKELLQGGYSKDTPCAVVYKATWQEQKLIRGKLEELAQLVEKMNIKNTALIIVGKCLGMEYELSKLYDATFETEFRKASL